LGPRAFPSHAFTGDRAWFATAEYRYRVIPDLAKLAGIGVAAFADRGGAWFAGSPQRNGTDVGIGLRIGPTRQADLRTMRIDLARRFANDVEPAGWVVVVGKGFTFRTAQ
jgi:hemolysin activation/secretion protein